MFGLLAFLMSNGVSKIYTQSPCLAYRFFTKITHYTHF